MGRKKKVELEKVITPKESISDIFEAMNNEEELVKKEKKEKKNKKSGTLSKNSNLKKDKDKDRDKDRDKDSDNCEIENINMNMNKNLNEEQIKQKNKVLSDKLAVVDKFFKTYPHLKKDKNNFIKEVLGEKVDKLQQYQQEYTFDKIVLEDKVYYRDKFNNIVDEKAKLVGFYKNDCNKYEYMLFV
jgi:hypothetical protein